jgi:hypothetical protein
MVFQICYESFVFVISIKKYRPLLLTGPGFIKKYLSPLLTGPGFINTYYWPQLLIESGFITWSKHPSWHAHPTSVNTPGLGRAPDDLKKIKIFEMIHIIFETC